MHEHMDNAQEEKRRVLSQLTDFAHRSMSAASSSSALPEPGPKVAKHMEKDRMRKHRPYKRRRRREEARARKQDEESSPAIHRVSNGGIPSDSATAASSLADIPIPPPHHRSRSRGVCRLRHHIQRHVPEPSPNGACAKTCTRWNTSMPHMKARPYLSMRQPGQAAAEATTRTTGTTTREAKRAAKEATTGAAASESTRAAAEDTAGTAGAAAPAQTAL